MRGARTLIWLTILLVLGIGVPAHASVVEDLTVCDAKVRDAPDDAASYDCFRAYINETEDRAGALMRLEALESLRPDNPHLLFTLALVSRGRLEDKTALFEKSARLFEDDDQLARASRALAEASYTSVRYLKLDQAKNQIARARDLATESGDPLAQMFVQIRASKIALFETRFDQAWALCQETISHPRFDDLWVEYRLSSLYMASHAGLRMGLLEQAFGLAMRAVELAKAEGEAKHRSDAAQAVLFVLVEATFENLFTADESFAIMMDMRELVDHDNTFSRYQVLRAMAALGVRFERLDHALEIERLGDEYDHPFMQRSAWAHKALILAEDHPDRLDEAMNAVRRAAATKLSMEDDFVLISYYKLIAQLSMRTAARDQAIETALVAIEAVESRRVRIADPETSARVAGTQASIHYMLADLLLGEDSPSEESFSLAVQVLDQLRARRLIQEVGDTSVLPDDVREQSRQITKDISRTQLKLMFAEEESERRLLRKELDRLESREILLLGDLDRRPRVIPVSEFASVAEIQERLSDDSAFLYFIANRSAPAYAIIVDRTSVRRIALPSTTSIASAIGMWNGAMSGEADLEASIAERLSEMLGDVFDDTVRGKSELFISADGPYHRLPFEALSYDGERLGHTQRILYVPSATYFSRAHPAKAPTTDARMLVLADPTFEGRSDASEVRDGTLTVASLGALPFARVEAEMVSDTLGRNTDVRVGDTASESYLKQNDMSQYRLIHFAAHALVNERVPSRSAVVLTPGAGEDGLLQQRDIGQLDLDDAIVVLAACHSAAGETIQGDGVLSLASSFLRSGANSVIASRWTLNDAESSRFYADVYSELANGVSVPEALRLARRQATRRGDHPATWAGVMAMGRDFVSLPSRPDERSSWMIPLLLGWVIAAVILVVWKRRSSARVA